MKDIVPILAVVAFLAVGCDSKGADRPPNPPGVMYKKNNDDRRFHGPSRLDERRGQRESRRR